MAFKIVVGYDGSEGGKAALDEAVGLAGRLSGEVLVTYAFGGRKQYAGAALTPRRTLKEMGEKLLEEALARVAGAWPTGEVMIQDGERQVMVIAGAERFSDQAMGISEKVVPDAPQRALFNQAFGVIDRLFGKTAEKK